MIRQIALFLLLALPALPATATEPERLEQALALIADWVQGQYDNRAQVAADEAAGLPDELKHRPMFQLFAPVSVPALDGHVVYQQASADGSTDPALIFRNGLVQFFIDAESGTIRQRELGFATPQAFHNAHLEPQRLAALRPEDLRWDPGCDFYLQPADDASEIRGPIKAGACRLQSQGLGKELVADDEVVIRPGEFWFLGRYVDADGRVMWGNASDEHVKMRRTAALADILRPDGGVLIFGATRGTGLELARVLSGRGQVVTVFLRRESDRSALESLPVRLVEGDAMNLAEVESAFATARFTAAVTTLGCYGCDTPPDYLGNRNVFDAAGRANVQRVLMVSTIGAGDSADAPPWIVRWFLEDVIALKTQPENHLAGSGLAYTIIRPGGLKDGDPTGTAALTEDTTAMGIITRADLADLIADCLADPTAIGRVYTAFDPTLSWPWDMW
jgi:uncharacterized protein YbjT (DUF2867 family)